MALVRTQFDHFTILREVGIGGMSRVFEAEDVSLGRRVALKILNRECSQDAARLAQFEREARLTASFSHPHIVKVYSVGRDRITFTSRWNSFQAAAWTTASANPGAQPEDEMLRLAVEMVQGLRAAQIQGSDPPGHQAGQHPLRRRRHGKNRRFRPRARSRAIWTNRRTCGPRRITCHRKSCMGERTRIAATCIRWAPRLFHALAGKPPYAKDTNSIEELKRIKSFPVHLRPAAPSLSDETCAIIDRLLSRKPEHRYRSYDELLEHFQFARLKLRARAAQAQQPAWRRLAAQAWRAGGRADCRAWGGGGLCRPAARCGYRGTSRR